MKRFILALALVASTLTAQAQLRCAGANTEDVAFEFGAIAIVALGSSLPNLPEYVMLHNTFSHKLGWYHRSEHKTPITQRASPAQWIPSPFTGAPPAFQPAQPQIGGEKIKNGVVEIVHRFTLPFSPLGGITESNLPEVEFEFGPGILIVLGRGAGLEPGKLYQTRATLRGPELLWGRTPYLPMQIQFTRSTLTPDFQDVTDRIPCELRPTVEVYNGHAPIDCGRWFHKSNPKPDIDPGFLGSPLGVEGAGRIVLKDEPVLKAGAGGWFRRQLPLDLQKKLSIGMDKVTRNYTIGYQAGQVLTGQDDCYND